MGQLQFFGGDWTQQKLDMLGKYLRAWAQVMKNQPFERVYIDAFAGTGYREAEATTADSGFFAPELAEAEPQGFFEGSAQIALRVEPSFHQYVFIEKTAKRFAELLTLKDKFPALADHILFHRDDSNLVLQNLCQRWSRNQRGVLFLDPFGMQVDWTTLEAVAATKAIDVWILFPTGMGVNRMLLRSGKIPDSWRGRLDRVFGTEDWQERFYRKSHIKTLFEHDSRLVKTATFNTIGEYYQERLGTIFADVASNPKVLSNHHGTPLFLLCFAVGNPSPKAIAAARRIAHHILDQD